MKKILLFPYHPDMETLINHKSVLKDAQIIGVCSYREDTVATDALNKKLGSRGDFEEMLAECDQILLLENYRNCRTEKYYEIMNKAINAGKQVIMVPQVERDLELEPYKGNYMVLKNIPDLNLPESERVKIFEREKYKIETPVIAVYGMGKHCNKFENQLLLKNVLDEGGYDTAWISSNPLGVLFGGYTMPDFLFDKKRSFESKVFAFNDFLYRLAFVKKPEVFLIGVPEGISEFEMHEYHHFAEYPLVIGSAVSVDSGVFCTYYLDTPDMQGIDEVASHCREKFGFPVHLVSIGKTTFETISGKEFMAFSFLQEDYIHKHYKAVQNLPDFITTVWDEEKTKESMRTMLGRLQTNMEMI